MRNAIQIRENRDREFWSDLARDPDIVEAIPSIDPEGVANLASAPETLPYSSENGGVLLIRRDQFGRIRELHTLFKRAGWGYEALEVGRQVFGLLFKADTDLVFTYSTPQNYRTQPPRSFGFKACGDEFENEFGRFRLWRLTREDWLASPGYARLEAA